MIPSHIFQFQHPIIVRKAPKNKYKFRQIAVIFQVGFVSFSVCSPDFSPHHVGADDSVGPICAPVLFFLLIEKEKNRRGVRRSQLHCASAGAAKAPYPQPSSSFPNCDRFTGSQFGHLEFYNAARDLDDGGQEHLTNPVCRGRTIRKRARIVVDPGTGLIRDLLFHRDGLFGLLDDALGGDAVGFEHLRSLAAAAELVVDAVADDRDRIGFAQ